MALSSDARRELLDALDRERQAAPHAHAMVARLPSTTRIAGTGDAYHVVLWSSLTEATADAVVETETAHYRDLGVSFEWKVYAHDQPRDLLQRLERRGFAVGPEEAVLVYDLSRQDSWRTVDITAVARIVTDDEVAHYRQVEVAVWGADSRSVSDELKQHLRSASTQIVGYVAYANGEPVSIGRLDTHTESVFGHLFGGATVPAHRGRGHYRKSVARRARDAARSGARYLLVDALPTSRPILERLGFEHLTTTWPCTWSG